MYSNNFFRKAVGISFLIVLFCAAGALFMTGCKKADDKQSIQQEPEGALLYQETSDDGSDTDSKGSYQIAKVRRGDFSYEMFAIGNLEYRDLYYETMETETAKVIEFKVAAGDKVNKGDVILTYEPVYDEVEYAQRLAQIEQQEKEYTAGYDTRRADIIKAEHELSGLKDNTEKEIKKLEIKKLKLALKKYQESSDNIKEQREELNEYQKGINKTEVVASHSGYILELGEADENSAMHKGNIVAVISPKKDYYIKVNDNTKGALRYNSDVKISVAQPGSGAADIEMPGRVVMCSNILSYANTTEEAYVEILDEPEGVNWSGAIKIYFDYKAAKNVLMLDSDAVLFENKNEGSNAVSVPYVYIYEDGKTYKRYIQVFGSNNKEYLVLEGLEEGQEVAIYR